MEKGDFDQCFECSAPNSWSNIYNTWLREEVSRYKNFQFLEYRPGFAKNKKNFFDLSLDVLLWSYHACQLKIRLGAEGNKLGLVLQCSGRSQFESSASVWPATKNWNVFFFFHFRI